MVFVKVRETYDLHTTRNKMTVIGIHTPKSDIIKRNYPGLLLQCKAYRPVSCDVRLACASIQPLDPLGVGTSEGDVAPEDVFNPLLYKAMSNLGMSQLEARINALSLGIGDRDVAGSTAVVDTSHVTSQSDEFNLYYGLLAETHNWKHASPQAGLSMNGLRPLVFEMVYNVGDNVGDTEHIGGSSSVSYPVANGSKDSFTVRALRGRAKEMPFINTSSYSLQLSEGAGVSDTYQRPGFKVNTPTAEANNCEVDVPFLNVVVGAIIVPPSRLHELFYRMVVEWTIEFSAIRSLADITDWTGLRALGDLSHYQNYNYSSTKEVVTGDSKTLLENDACMVSTNADIQKVM